MDAVVFGYIYWLTKLKNEKCFASNATLASLAKTTAQVVGNSLTTLDRAGFITRRFKNDNPHHERLEIICLLGFRKVRVSPTGEGTLNPQVKGVSPTGEQNKSIEEEDSISVAIAPQYTISKDPPENERRLKGDNRTFQHAEQVFSWFPKPEPHWKLNKTERAYAELLYKRGEERVRAALRFVKSQKDNPDFQYKILKPSQLESKWEDLKHYADKIR